MFASVISGGLVWMFAIGFSAAFLSLLYMIVDETRQRKLGKGVDAPLPIGWLIGDSSMGQTGSAQDLRRPSPQVRPARCWSGSLADVGGGRVVAGLVSVVEFRADGQRASTREMAR